MLNWLSGKSPSRKRKTVSKRKVSTKKRGSGKKATRFVIAGGKPRAVVNNPNGKNYYNRRSADGKVRKVSAAGMRTYTATEIRSKMKKSKSTGKRRR